MFHILREGVHLEPAFLTCILKIASFLNKKNLHNLRWVWIVHTTLNLQFEALPIELKNPHQPGLSEKNQVQGTKVKRQQVDKITLQ